MDLNVFINAMKKRAAGMPQQPAAGNFVAPQLQPLKKAIGVEAGNTAEPVEKALSNEGIAPGNEAPAQPSDLQMLTESLNNITKLEEMKQKALTKQQQPAAANSVQSARTVANMTGSTAPTAASAAPTGQFKGASADAVKQVAKLLKKADGGPFSGEDTKRIHSTLQTDIMRNVSSEYARKLAEAYLRSTGKHLADPGKHMTPIYGYVLGSAPNIDPEIAKQLSPAEAKRFKGWGTFKSNVTPGMLQDGADYINGLGGFIPLDQEGIKPDDKTLSFAQLGEQLQLAYK